MNQLISHRLLNLLTRPFTNEVNSRDVSGQTPLYFAAELGKLNMTSLLLEYGADVNATDAEGRSPLWIAREERGHNSIRKIEATLSREHSQVVVVYFISFTKRGRVHMWMMVQLEGNALIDLRHGFKVWMSMDEFLFFNVHNLKISSDRIIIKSSGKSLIPQILYTYQKFGKSLIQ